MTWEPGGMMIADVARRGVPSDAGQAMGGHFMFEEWVQYLRLKTPVGYSKAHVLRRFPGTLTGSSKIRGTLYPRIER